MLFLQILRDVPANESILTQVALSRSGRMLFSGTNTGVIRAFKFPLTVPGEWQELQAHAGSITKVDYTVMIFTNRRIFS